MAHENIPERKRVEKSLKENQANPEIRDHQRTLELGKVNEVLELRVQELTVELAKSVAALTLEAAAH